MAAPPLTARGAVAGTRLDNGFGILLAFASNPTIEVYEKSVTPPAIDGGEPIDTTTNHNVASMSKAPQCLDEWGDVTVVAAYDPAVLPELQVMTNLPQGITVHYPDATSLSFWGYLRRTEHSALVKGQQPELTLTVVVTNWDPVNCVEAIPVLVAGTGSCAAC